MRHKIEKQDERLDVLGSLVLAYSVTIDRLVRRMRNAGIIPDFRDIHEQVRRHMHMHIR
ncbi:hypothetical protein ABZ383_18415 [Streptomyces sp. NPDC005900]|uniref:hypothetical protein n=1 Tax=Streptomyces sp. NPDC005900 TaxID=3154569 RepID=UPI0033E59AB6